ncbi:MAG: GerMN domain-containing protein [Cetobacterium sp.]|uniref:GerMN domain-containing protein n=1 Tax=Cetobacterium sp. TaxID=2071632 RepID=UPI002FC6E485
MSKKLKGFLFVLILITIITGLYSNKLNHLSKEITQISAPTSNEVSSNDYSVTLFFPNLKQNKLNSEDIILSKGLTTKEEILKDITAKLITKLEDNHILKKEQFKYEVYIKNRTLYLDLDSKILLSAKNPQEELLIIYSFVNTLLSLGGNDNVVLLINGSPAEKVNFINLSKSYKINSNI